MNSNILFNLLPHPLQVLFYLACQRVREAVRAYLQAEMFREAILLAKSRLVPEDPMIEELYYSWAEWCEKKIMYEQAAKW